VAAERRAFSRTLLELDVEREIDRICAALRRQVGQDLHRRGAVLGLSGGIDSSLTAALCARALGPERVLALFLPERESSGESLRLGQMAAGALSIPSETWDITSMLEAAGCYRRRDEAIRRVMPQYADGWRCKLALQGSTGGKGISFFHVVAQDLSGEMHRARLTSEAYLGILSAMNFKQRVRKMVEYHHADRLVYAVAATPNRLEYDQGFFVKNGDGAGDVKPIAHLFKSQVYRLSAALGVPEEILQRPPTTDTYPLEQTQSEFYFALSHEMLDLCLLGFERGEDAGIVADATGMAREQVEESYRAIVARRRAAEYLHAAPLTIEDPPPGS
jgi:NAD+ synthase